MGDGTFQFVPAKFKQMYSLHTMIDKSVFPAAFALMEEKTAQSYEIVFGVMKGEVFKSRHRWAISKSGQGLRFEAFMALLFRSRAVGSTTPRR